MSLLLDALKKAEKAKDDAKRRAQSESDPDETVMQVRTRNELPDISSPLEIHSEDIPGGDQKKDELSLVQDAFPPATERPPIGEATAAPSSGPRPAAADTPKRRAASREEDTGRDPLAGQRAAAKNVFETKFKEPNPKLPFQITMAFLGVFAIGTVIYFWYELRPPPPLVNSNPRPPSDERNAQVSPPRASPTQATPAPAPAPQTGAIPGMPMQSSAPAAPAPAPAPAAPAPAAPAGPAATEMTAAPSPTRAPRTAVKRAAPAPADRSRPAAPSKAQAQARELRAPDERSKLSVRRAAPAVNPKLQAGWLAYNQGDLAVARANYQEVVQAEPANRDALLGMAALEIRANRPAEAEAYYQKLLEINPRDPHAQAGLLALRAHLTDPVHAESRVKNLLANDPDAHVLYFTLGNEYAQQRRWPEAQQAYFRAFSADPENPDFAYNLAVSLDHVRQPKLALEYYRRAISLAQQRSSNFDQTLARTRAQELAR